MRIGQLARRLELAPSVILEFLGSKNIETEGGANSRLSDEVTKLVIGHFAPEKLSEPIIEEVEEAVVETPAPPVEEAKPEPVADANAPVEVIRVSKVELQGLKVLGKIDLPEPKKKAEPTPQPQPEEQQQQQQRPPRREFQKRNDRNERREREWKNPIEAKRQQEQREAERKKKEQAEALKEKRTNHYYSKVKSVPTKAVRRIEEQTVVEDLEVKEAPKGLFGKFLRWLRT